MIKKRNGRKEVLDITKIQKMTIDATADLDGVSQSELELDSQIKFIDGMSSSDIQDALIKTAVEKIDIYVAFDLEKGEQDLDEDEFIHVREFALDELTEMIFDGRIEDNKTISAILAYKAKYKM